MKKEKKKKLTQGKRKKRKRQRQSHFKKHNSETVSYECSNGEGAMWTTKDGDDAMQWRQ